MEVLLELLLELELSIKIGQTVARIQDQTFLQVLDRG